MLEISLVAAELATSREGLIFMELVAMKPGTTAYAEGRKIYEIIKRYWLKRHLL
jgi:hypothetical protein